MISTSVFSPRQQGFESAPSNPAAAHCEESNIPRAPGCPHASACHTRTRRARIESRRNRGSCGHFYELPAPPTCTRICRTRTRTTPRSGYLRVVPAHPSSSPAPSPRAHEEPRRRALAQLSTRSAASPPLCGVCCRYRSCGSDCIRKPRSSCQGPVLQPRCQKRGF